jgi:heme-degrading monooxygenase HmoA
MITRIVKMTFHPEKADEFIGVFTLAKPLIESFIGCTKVELLRDKEQPNIFFTMSSWITSEALETYRESELFNSTWDKAKKLFSDRPEAWSIEKLL